MLRQRDMGSCKWITLQPLKRILEEQKTLVDGVRKKKLETFITNARKIRMLDLKLVLWTQLSLVIFGPLGAFAK